MAEYAAAKASGLRLKGGKKLTAKRSSSAHDGASSSRRSGAGSGSGGEAARPLRHGTFGSAALRQ